MNIFDKLKELSGENELPKGKPEYIIAGLGNPGIQYENTRHNAGFLTVDALSRKHSFAVDRHKFKSMYCDTVINGKRCLVMKPTTYMNNSGEAIEEAMSFYKIPPEKLIVIYDDISLEPSKLRIRRKGSHGGHNGIKSIVALCDSENFPRIKVGVGKKPHPDYDLADWVLSRFTDNEMKLISEATQKACEAIELIVSGRIDEAMNRFNS